MNERRSLGLYALYTLVLFCALPLGAQAQFDGKNGDRSFREDFQTLHNKAVSLDEGNKNTPKPAASPFVIPFEFQISETTDKTFGKKNEEVMGTIMYQGLELALEAKPQRDNIFSWAGNKALLANKKLTLIFVTSGDTFPTYKQIQNGLPPNADAATVAITTPNDGKMEIILFLVVDRLFIDRNAERRDKFARVAVALAHELFGNVQIHLNVADIRNNVKPVTPDQRKKKEQAAYTAGIDYIGRLKKTAVFTKLSVEIQRDFDAALEREKKGLEGWKTK